MPANANSASTANTAFRKLASLTRLKPCDPTQMPASSGVSNIAVSVGEQSKVSNTIARHVDDMAKMAKASHTSIENVGLDIERLRRLAGDMQAAVASFKV